MFDTTIRDRLRQKVSVPEIYPKSLKGNRGHCELHDNTSSPSFQYYPKDNSWCCYSCQTGGDVINLYSHIHNLSYREALLDLAKLYKIEVSEADKEKIETIESIELFFIEFTKLCYDNLKKSEMWEEIRKKRGFSIEIMDRYKIGLCDSLVIKQISTNYDKEFLQKAGLLNEKGNWCFKNRIVFPYFNHQHKPSYFIFRKIDSNPDFNPAKYLKLMKTEFVSEILFGIDSLSIEAYRDKPLIITEGITDAMNVIDCGYPCVSPVTIGFKQEDYDKILGYAKRFEQVLIINDTDLNNTGTIGAEKTLKFLLKNGINGFISIIPNPERLESIDVNDYVSKYGKLGMDNLVNNKMEGFAYFLDRIDTSSKQIDIEDLLMLIPEGNVKQFNDVLAILKTKTKIRVTDLRIINKEGRLKEKEAKELEAKRIKERNKAQRLEIKDHIIDSFQFNNAMIENRLDKLVRITETEEGFNEQVILENGIELLHKMSHLGQDYFSYKFRDMEYNTQNRTMMLMTLKNFTYGGELGRDIVKKAITHQGEILEYKKCKTIMGFDNGWVLPQLEAEQDYKILIYTDIQKRVYDKCKNIIQIYTEEQKKEIIAKLKRFVEITKFRRDKEALIIGWNIAAPFKLAILNYFNFFPGLLLIGDKQSGKTYGCKFYAIDFYGVWDNYMAGGTIKTEGRCEDILATSTFPIQFDELEYVKYAIIEILKSTLTGIHDYMRKLSVLEDICKPEVAPFCITTNEAPKPFLDPALNSKMLIGDFTASEVIIDNPEWNRLRNELKEVKLFSFIYEYTKNWTNKDVIDILKKIEEDSKQFNNNSRLKKKYVVVQFGLYLFKEVFGIDLIDNNNPELYEKSELIITESLYDQFISFCEKAIDFQTDFSETRGSGQFEYQATVKAQNPKYLTTPLEKNNSKDYIFTPDNLRDFNEYNKEFSKENYTMRNLGNLLNDAIKDKDKIRYGVYSVRGKQYHGIKIECNLIDGKIEVNKKMTEDQKEDLKQLGKILRGEINK